MGVRRGAPGVAGLACVALAVLCSPAAFAQQPESFIPGSIHTIFSTECNKYFDWRVGGCCCMLQSLSPLSSCFPGRQSLGLVHSARHVGQEGPITRLMACNECVHQHSV